MWKEVYRNQSMNAEIAASSSEDFAISASDTAAAKKYGSFNRAIISNLSDYPIRISLDGNIFTEMGSQGIAVIDPEDGLFFNLIRITNLSAAAAIVANKISIRWAKAIQV